MASPGLSMLASVTLIRHGPSERFPGHDRGGNVVVTWR
jgi:hypothetical protein